jgi:hypothetical protein
MKPAKPAARTPKPFHAVEVKAGSGCCAAAKSVAGQRFLSRGIPLPPTLPMKGCDRPSACQCRYVHYDDRRTEDRRSGWGGVFTTWDTTSAFAARGQGKTRKSRGRRKDD